MKRLASRLRLCAHCGQVPVKHKRRRFCSKACAYSARTLSLPDRFWKHVERRGPDDCWPWIAALSNSGYGLFNSLRSGSARGAHCAAYELTRGPIPPGLCVCHSCDSRYPVGSTEYRRCVNPRHLFLGTHLNNLHDASTKGRIASGDRHYSRRTPMKLVRGERHGASKLTAAKVRSIRRAVANGVTQQTLGVRFGVSQSVISEVANRKSWRHVT